MDKITLKGLLEVIGVLIIVLGFIIHLGADLPVILVFTGFFIFYLGSNFFKNVYLGDFILKKENKKN